MQRFKSPGQAQRGSSPPMVPSPNISVRVAPVDRARISAGDAEQIPALAGDHGLSHCRLNDRRGESVSPTPWYCISANKLTMLTCTLRGIGPCRDLSLAQAWWQRYASDHGNGNFRTDNFIAPRNARRRWLSTLIHKLMSNLVYFSTATSLGRIYLSAYELEQPGD